MRKASTLLAALLLVGQVVGWSTTVLANEKQPDIVTEESTTANTDTTIESSIQEEATETTMSDLSTNNTESSTEEISAESTTDSTDTQASHSKPEANTSNSNQQESSNSEGIKPSETKLSEEKNIENSTTSTEQFKEHESIKENTSTIDSKQENKQSAVSLKGNEGITASTVEKYVQQPTQVTGDQENASSNDETESVNIHFEKNESVESFIRKIGESARKIGKENDLYASVMIAQAILESSSGQSQLAQAPNYNLFGIKGTYKGKGVSFVTQEDLGEGTLYTTQSTFRQYDDYEDSLKDYALLLKEGLTGNSHFYDGAWKKNAKTYQEATKFLTGRYATDTSYNKKLNGLIETYDLTTYDKGVMEPQLSKEGYIVPVKNCTISSPFGFRGGEFHRGLDLAAPQGEPIYASKAGVII
uniref:glucosaminidase domain-containing protein n=1 Tax=unclassified Enterococcus TaxID=2608891 RepID=UPI0013EA06C2